MVTYFKYPGRVVSATDDDLPAVVRNLAQAKTVWRRMLHILSREGATPRVSGFFFKAVIQAVLLFREGAWVVTPRMGKAMGWFQTQVVRRMTGQIPRRTTDRTFKYASAAAAGGGGFLTMEEYFRRRQNTVAQYIAT